MRRTRHHYGVLRSQFGDLWLPASAGSGPERAPVVVLIHGGYWRSIYTKAVMNRLARAMASRGWAAWNIEYRRTGPLGGGGGWPATLADAGRRRGKSAGGVLPEGVIHELGDRPGKSRFDLGSLGLGQLVVVDRTADLCVTGVHKSVHNALNVDALRRRDLGDRLP